MGFFEDMIKKAIQETIEELAGKNVSRETLSEPASEPASEPKQEPAPEPKQEPAPEPKQEPAPEPKQEFAALSAELAKLRADILNQTESQTVTKPDTPIDAMARLLGINQSKGENKNGIGN